MWLSVWLSQKKKLWSLCCFFIAMQLQQMWMQNHFSKSNNYHKYSLYNSFSMFKVFWSHTKTLQQTDQNRNQYSLQHREYWSERVNYGRIFIFEWTVPFKLSTTHKYLLSYWIMQLSLTVFFCHRLLTCW